MSRTLLRTSLRTLLLGAARLLLILTMLMGGFTGVGCAQEIGEMRWGFDNRVVPGEFNLISVLVSNTSDQPFEDALVLQQSLGLSRVGAPVREPCFLAPRSSRLVQLAAFGVDEGASWSLRWSTARLASTALPQPRVGPRAAVLLEATVPLGDPIEDLRTFPAAWFPALPGVTATLSDAVLDHAPEWDPARRQAFLSWLRAGGRLHLLRSGESYPTFTGELAILNQNESEFHIGMGLVVRDPRTRGRVKATMLKLATQRSPEDPTKNRPAAVAPGILRGLQALVQPDHSWGLIFFCSAVFLVLVGPVHYRLSKRRLDYRGSLAVLVGIVAFFTWLFLQLGARGYDERSKISTLAYAYRLDDTTWQATQYTSAFVTSGGNFRIAANAEQALYSTAQQSEAVPGTIENGRNGALVVDIPLFSSRGFVHRAAITDPPFALRVTKWDPIKELESLELAISGPFASADVLSAWATYGGDTIDLSYTSDRMLATINRQPLKDRLQLEQIRTSSFEYAGPVGSQPINPSTVGAATRLRDRATSLAAPMLAERLHLLHEDDCSAFEERRTLSVFVLAKSPQAFHVRGAGLGVEESYVVYHVEIEL